MVNWLEPEDYYASALLGAMEMLKTGTTTVLDHFPSNQAVSFHGAPQAIQAMKNLGIRHLIALTLSDKTFGETIPLKKGETSFSGGTMNLGGGTIRNAKSWLWARGCRLAKARHPVVHSPERSCAPARFCENGSSVDTVIVNGEVVLQQGRLVRMKEEGILETAEKSALRSSAGARAQISAVSNDETVLREMYYKIMKERKDSVAKHGAS